MYKKVGIVLGVISVVAAIAASVFALQSSDTVSGPDDAATSRGLSEPSALNPPAPIQPTRTPILDEAAPPARGVAVGTPESLPFVMTRLTAEERDVAESLALHIPDVRENLRGKRFQVVEGEILLANKIAPCKGAGARNCATISIFNYTDGHCIQVIIDLKDRKPLHVKLAGGGCSVSAAEVKQARQIAQADSRVQQVIQEGQGRYIGGRIVFPRPGTGIAGDRYVSAKYTLDNGTASAEFVVNLTTQTLCYEC